jgi:hypothetical protein
MTTRRATLIVAGLTGIFVLLSGCASVKSTAVFYKSIRNYPAKPPDTPIPILTEPPGRAYEVIGRLAFKSDRGWGFLRKSMIYNAQIRGADAVVLKTANTRREVSVQRVPSRVDWFSIYRRDKDGNIRSNLVPYVRPGYTQRRTSEITAIDAEMIVFER